MTVDSAQPGSGRLLAHELTHLSLRNGYLELPLWKEEGLCEFVSFRGQPMRAELIDVLALVCSAGEGLQATAIRYVGERPKTRSISLLPNSHTDQVAAEFKSSWAALDPDPGRRTSRAPSRPDHLPSFAASYIDAFLRVSLALEAHNVDLRASPQALSDALGTDELLFTRVELVEHAWKLLSDLYVRDRLDDLAARTEEGLGRRRELRIQDRELGWISIEQGSDRAPHTRFGAELLGLPQPLGARQAEASGDQGM